MSFFSCTPHFHLAIKRCVIVFASLLHLPYTMSKRKASGVNDDLSPPEISITTIYDLLPRMGVSIYCNEKVHILCVTYLLFCNAASQSYLIHTNHTSRIIIIHPLYNYIIYFRISFITNIMHIIL